MIFFFRLILYILEKLKPDSCNGMSPGLLFSETFQKNRLGKSLTVTHGIALHMYFTFINALSSHCRNNPISTIAQFKYKFLRNFYLNFIFFYFSRDICNKYVKKNKKKSSENFFRTFSGTRQRIFSEIIPGVVQLVDFDFFQDNLKEFCQVYFPGNVTKNTSKTT